MSVDRGHPAHHGLRPRARRQRRMSSAWLDEHKRGFGHFISGAFAHARRRCSTSSIRRPASASRRVTQGTRGRRRRGGAAARTALPAWAALVGRRARAASLRAGAACAEARALPRRARDASTTASRSARSRDIDIPLVARHFYHHAGWASLIESEFPGTRAGRRLRADHSVELPAADAGLEDRAGARRRQHRGAEAGRIHAADRARLRRDLRRGGLARRAWSTSSPATARPARARRPSRRRQDRLHRLDRGRPRDPPGDRRHGQEAVAGTRRQVAVHRVRRRRSRQRGRGRGRCDLVQPGPGLLRRLAAAGARERGADASTPSCARAWRRCASAIRSTSRSTSAPSSRRSQLERIDALVEAGERGGRRVLAGRRRRCPARAASIRRRCSPMSSRLRRWRSEEIFGPVLVGDDLPHAGRSGRARQQHAATAWPPPCGPRTSIAPRRRAAPQGRRGLGQLAPTCSTPPPASAAIAKAASAARAGARACTNISCPTGRRSARRRQRRHASAPRPAPAPAETGDAHRPHRQAVHRRQAGAARFGLQLRRARPKGRAVGQAGLGNRKDIRNAVEAASEGDRLGRGDGAQPRAGALLRGREPRRRAPTSSPARLRAMTGATAKRRSDEVDAAIRRIVHYAALADKFDGAVHATQIALRHAGDERALRRDGRRLPGRGAAARLRLARCCRRSRWAIAWS